MDDFYEALRNNLVNKGLTEDQAKIVNEEIKTMQANEEKAAAEATAANQQAQADMIFKLIDKIMDNSHKISDIFKPHWLRVFYKLSIAFILVGSVVLLSWKGILGATEASTLLGGIIGYILGNATSK